MMALRNDPRASAMMAAHLATDNSAALQRTLGRTPDAGELYMAHFLGAEGAGKFLTALAANPSQSAAAILPRAAASNRNVFYDASGAPRSVGTVMAMMKGRMATAMGVLGGVSGGAKGDVEDELAISLDASLAETKIDPWENPELKAAWDDLTGTQMPVTAQNGGMAGEFAATKSQAENGGSAPYASPVANHSMADTLRSTFGLGVRLGGDNTSAAPEFVRTAYGRLQALGL
jgi:hypothetical protein